jgi:hypothetical protein
MKALLSAVIVPGVVLLSLPAVTFASEGALQGVTR